VLVSYEIFDANPFIDPYNSDVPASDFVSVGLAVNAPPNSSAPEPSAWVSVVAGVLLMVAIRRWTTSDWR
jgi:hypothetical protein